MFISTGTPDARGDEWIEPPPGEEARATLSDVARRELGVAMAQLLVEHAMLVGAEGDFAMKRAALVGLLERARSRSAGGRIVRRLDGPSGGRFSVTLPGEASREVWLECMAPLRSSCGCADFVHSGLGLCAHGLAVLGHLTRSRRARSRPPSVGPVGGKVLRWDPYRPLSGSYDALGRFTRSGDVLPAPRSADARVATTDRLLALRCDKEPACEPVLLRERRTAADLALARQTRPRAVRALSSLTRTLYPYQREAVLRFLSAGKLLIADDMGLGKTTQAIAACHALLASGAVTRVLLVVPASLKPQWCREWRSTTTFPIRAVNGSPEARAEIYRAAPGVLVVGYEQLRNDLAHIGALDPEVVVLDEAQRIKNPATKTACAVAALAPRYRLALTGTPLQNRLSELASVLAFVDPLAVGPTWQLIARHMFEVGDAGSGESGARYLDELRERLGPVMVRRLRSEILSQLPSRTDTRVPVTLTDAQLEAHARLEESIRILMHIRRDRPLTFDERERLMRLLGEQRRICNGLAQRDFAERWPELKDQPPTDARLAELHAPKLAAFRELLRQVVVEQKRKVVVFSEWRSMLRLAAWAIGDLLREAGLEAGFFTGAESPKLRERALVDFHDEPRMAVLFLTDAGGVGLNLQRAATACVQLELPWNPAVMEQRIARIHRLGQVEPVDVFHVVSEGGIESRIAGLLGRKAALSAALLDRDDHEVRFGTSAGIFDLAASLEHPPEPIECAEAELVPIEAEADGPLLEAPQPAVPRLPTPDAPRPDPAVTAPRMVQRPDGGFSLDVPAELAAPMAVLFASMARLLEGASAQPTHGAATTAGS